MKYFLNIIAILLFLDSCETDRNDLENNTQLSHDHTPQIEDFVSHFDTSIHFAENLLSIDTLNYIKNSKFNFAETNIDSCLILNKYYWDKHFLPIAYINDSIISNLNFETGEGNQYVIISKTMIGKINLVLIGRNDFNSEIIDYFDLLLIDSKKILSYYVILGGMQIN